MWTGFINLNAIFILISAALHRCARSDNINGCRILVSYQADVNIVNLQGCTPAHLASSAIIAILQGKHDTVFLYFSGFRAQT